MKSRTVRCALLVLGPLVGLGLTGCGATTQVNPAAQRTAQGLTKEQALAAVRAYDQGNNTVNAHLDGPGLTRIEVPPLLTADRAWMQITDALHQTVPRMESKSPVVYIPGGADPNWFLTVSTRVRGGVPGPQSTYSVYVRSTSTSPWKVAYSLTPTGDVPDLAVSTNGTASAPGNVSDLLMEPAKLASAILAHYQRGLQGKDTFQHSAALDEQLGAGYTLGVKVLRQRDEVLSRALAKDSFKGYSLRTSDGGALVFSANIVKDSLVPKKSDGIVSLRAGSNDAALLAKPGGASAKKFLISRIETFMTYIPKKSSGTGVTVLGYSETAVSIKK
ncbi:hypothetical protein OG762_34215 [Streptomyces sp. NBC_01136]|uniref:hypothetical protein n=1 Tax=unclassified Streptomyces TaxID=2593676 RepID=UPI0032468D11|nr:hypothetical protein OG762_34215 [Streptomyces sp. NBC_01136]